ncbi:MAG: ECF transporter S component [Thermomicrobiales bacterium]|nr:ECF transporter S component [Thermomicrobiales bacterium]
MLGELHNRRAWTLAIATIVGVLAFLYPFVLPGLEQVTDDTSANTSAAPLLFAGLVVLILAVTVTNLTESVVGMSRMIALLGVLVAIDATLRLVPSIVGASPIFLLIMLVGAVFGPAMGFQMGALTLLISAFITGGVGPWLPFQMITCAWVGMTAGWLPRHTSVRRRVVDLAIFGALWGLLFGAIMNLWFWPFTAPGVDADSALYWQPGISAAETFARYVRFYALTSLGFDLFRAIGNVLLVLLLGAPVIRLLERYRRQFTWQPWEDCP